MPKAQKTGATRGDDEVLHADLPREPGDMHRRGAAGRDEGEVPGIAAAPAEHDVDRPGHLGVHDVVDGGRRLGHGQAERVRRPSL